MSPISVIIVGAGPSGLLLARLLTQSGMRNIRLLEREKTPTDDHRAVLYQAISLHEFKRAGIIEDFEAAAHRLKSVCWRDAAGGGKRLFGMPAGDTLLMNVRGLTGIIKQHLARTDQAEILVDHNVVSVGQDANKTWVDVDTPDGRQRLEASYVVGCDGASSTVRKSVFGPASMEGFTWDKQLVAADVSTYKVIAAGIDSSIRFDVMHLCDFQTSRSPIYSFIQRTHGYFSPCQVRQTFGGSYTRTWLRQTRNLLRMRIIK